MPLSAIIEQSKKNREDWKYTNLVALEKMFAEESASVSPRSICKQKRNIKDSLAVLPKDNAFIRLVFTNGVFDNSASSAADFVSGNEKEGFSFSLTGNPPPIELLFLSEPQSAPTEISTKLRFDLLPESKLTLIEHHAPSQYGKELSVFAHVIETEINVGEKAEFTHIKIAGGNGAHGFFHFAQTFAHIAENASYSRFDILRGGRIVRNEIEASLGENSSCFLNGIMLLRGESHADTTTKVIHSAPNGKSSQNYRCIAANKARGVFQGKTTVRECAQKTEAKQLCRALLLSHQAEVDAKPELEIYADDVKCSHGCAIGNLDNEALFYLQSRGIEERLARRMLIEAFALETAEETKDETVKKILRSEIGEWINV